MNAYNVAVLGGGSVGLCLAASFSQAGANVTLLVRKDAVARLSEKSLTVSGLLGEHRTEPGAIRVVDAARPDDETLSCDMLLVTTKAYDVADALSPFARKRPGVGAVLLLQNGMGSAERARAVMGENVAIYSSAMMIGMVRNTPTDVDVSAQSSPIFCGPLLGDDDAALSTMLGVARRGFVPMERDHAIRETISFKLLFNSCMNPTGALIDRTYGELLENPHSRRLIADLAQEALEVFARQGYRPAESGEHYVDEVLSKIIFPRSAGHRSSMLQDLEASRRTEVDFLNGAIVDMAQAVGLRAPKHEAITALIHARELAR
ncbi:MAG: ketopantoate reductase family protein [Burkholderiales bacterium]|nr:MAG: ketopantoate reductase family protein [Burkholderiales bacterium]